MRDLKSNIAVHQSLPVTGRTADDTGDEVDRSGFESVTFAIHVEQWSDGSHAFSAEHRDDGGEWEAVPASELVGDMPTIQDEGGSPSFAAGANETTTVGYIGDRQFVRPKVTVTDTPSEGAVYGIDVILGHANERPVI